MRDIIILGLILGTLPFCFARPFFGILMWQFVSLLNPHRFAYGAAYDFPVAEAIAVPTLVGCLLFTRNWKTLATREVALILVLWGWFTFTTLYDTRLPLFSDFAPITWYRWRFVSKVLLMTLVTVGLVNTRSRLRWYLLVTAGSLGFLVLKAVPFMIITGGSFRLYGPPGSSLADNNDLGLALNMTIPMFFFLAQTETGKRLRLLMGFTFLATIPAILFTYSRGALIGLALILVLMVMQMRQRLVLIPVLFLAAVFAAFFTPEQWQHRMDFRRSGALIDDSAESRFNAWTYCWRLVQDFPLTGGGFEAFTQPLFDRYAPNPRDVHGPHSVYFGVLAEHGFIGLGLYLSLVLSCLISLRKVRVNARRWGDERQAKYALMLQFSLLGFLISGAFLGRAYFDYYFSIVACIAVLKSLPPEEPAEEIADEMVIQEQMA
jgi:putative inorganic carbon (HCO3(-)) transporter